MPKGVPKAGRRRSGPCKLPIAAVVRGVESAVGVGVGIGAVATRAEKLGYLALCIRDEKVSWRVRLAAIEIDAKMQGHNLPDRVELAVGGGVNLWMRMKSNGGGDDDE